MKTSHVEYYSDQINSFTPCVAIEKQNKITVIFPDGKKTTVHTEVEVGELWKKCINEE